jgi:hypothetical protein
MKRVKRIRPRVIWINALSLVVALVLGTFVLSYRLDDGFSEAAAQPKRGLPAPEREAADAGADAAPVAADGGDAGDASVDESAAPIDIAVVGKDGGVPYHPSGTKYRSPFAKPNATQVARVKVGFVLNSVDDYDVKTGTFSADFFLSMTSSTPMPELALTVPNGKLDVKETIADRPTFKLFRMAGQFKSPADLRKYPFDSQELRIVIEDDRHGIDQVRFQVDRERTTVARGFRAVGWQVSYVEARSISHSYPDRFEGDDLYYGRYIFTLGLDRFAASATFKVFVPALVIVFISLLGMWVPPNEMEVRSTAGAPMLAGAVLFHFALMQELPATSYLTRADKLMLGVYVCLLLGMISTWCMFLVKPERQMLVFRIARAVVPVMTVAVMLLATLM